MRGSRSESYIDGNFRATVTVEWSGPRSGAKRRHDVEEIAQHIHEFAREWAEVIVNTMKDEEREND
jgi:hypothetical protein